MVKDYVIANSSKSAIKLTLVDEETGVKKDYTLLPKDDIDASEFAGKKVMFGTEVEYSIRQKKYLTQKFKAISKTQVSRAKKAESIQLPTHFTKLKVKKVHEEQ